MSTSPPASKKWKNGRYGNGQILLLPDAGQLLVLSEEGELVLIRANPIKAGRGGPGQKVLDGKTWNHPCSSATGLRPQRRGSRLLRAAAGRHKARSHRKNATVPGSCSRSVADPAESTAVRKSSKSGATPTALRGRANPFDVRLSLTGTPTPSRGRGTQSRTVVVSSAR